MFFKVNVSFFKMPHLLWREKCAYNMLSKYIRKFVLVFYANLKSNISSENKLAYHETISNISKDGDGPRSWVIMMGKKK